MSIWKINLIIMFSTFIATIVFTVLQALVLNKLVKNMENGKGFSENWLVLANAMNTMIEINTYMVAVSIVMVIPIFIIGLLIR